MSGGSHTASHNRPLLPPEAGTGLYEQGLQWSSEQTPKAQKVWGRGNLFPLLCTLTNLPPLQKEEAAL